MAIERTFSIIKPDATSPQPDGRHQCDDRKSRAAYRRAETRVDQPRAGRDVLRRPPGSGRSFGELVDFMMSGPVVVQVLEGENAIAAYRDLMGATDPAKAAPRHHSQGLRAIDRRELGARLRCRRHRREGNSTVLQPAKISSARGISLFAPCVPVARAVRRIRLRSGRFSSAAAASPKTARMGSRLWVSIAQYLILRSGATSRRRAGLGRRLLDRRSPDPPDRRSALWRQRHGDRARLPRIAAASKEMGHHYRRQPRRDAAYRVDRRGQPTYAASLPEVDRRIGAALHRGQIAGARESRQE